MLGIPDPSQAFVIQKLLHAARKSQRPDGRRPITPSILKTLIDALTSALTSFYDHQLYKTLFLFTFYSLARISEVTATSSSNHTLHLSDVTVQTTPQPSLSVYISFKLNQRENFINFFEEKFVFQHFLREKKMSKQDECGRHIRSIKEKTT